MREVFFLHGRRRLDHPHIAFDHGKRRTQFMGGDLMKSLLFLSSFSKRIVGAVQFLHTLLHHAFHHLVEAVQIIIQAGVLKRNGCLHGKCTVQAGHHPD